MTKLAPEWVRTSDPVIRSPARYRWATAPANYLYINNMHIVVKTYPPIDPIVAPLILITFISVTFSNHERNVSYARYG